MNLQKNIQLWRLSVLSKFRVGIIGCGKIFPMHVYSLLERNDVEIVAISDVKEDRVQTWAKKLEVKPYLDYKEMLDTENLDVVHICTPHYLHKEMMIASLKRDTHVVCEKPATINYQDLLDVYEVQKKTQKEVAISFQNRYNPASLEIKRVIESGELGNIMASRAILAWNRSDDYYGQSDWKGTWEKEGGGVLIDQAIHTLDLVNWVMNRPVEDINISMGRRGHSKIDVEDYVEGVIKYEGNVMTSINFINHYVIDAPIEVEIIGTKGTVNLVGDLVKIDFNDGRQNIVGRNPNDQFNIEGIKQYWGVGHKAFIKDVYNTLQSDMNITRNSLEDVMSIHKLVFDIYDQGRKDFNIR